LLRECQDHFGKKGGQVSPQKKRILKEKGELKSQSWGIRRDTGYNDYSDQKRGWAGEETKGWGNGTTFATQITASSGVLPNNQGGQGPHASSPKKR